MELGRLEYLQALVTEFQVTDSTGNKRRRSLALSVWSVSSHTPALFPCRGQGAGAGEPGQLRLQSQQLRVSAAAAGAGSVPGYAHRGERDPGGVRHG